MDKRTDTLATLVALNTRRLTAIERSLELLVRHVGTEALADELDVLARMDREDAAGSLYWRLARLARRPKGSGRRAGKSSRRARQEDLVGARAG